MEEKTKICSNCEEPIPESKLFLHERFCAQNIKKCKICKKPIVIDDEEQHMVENHSEVKCEFCEKPFPKNQIEEHIKNCDQKMVECQYCELQVTIKDKPQHEYMCGAKTEQCMKCKKYIQVKDMKNHKRVGCKLEEKVTNNNLLITDPQLEKAIMKSIKDNNNKKNNYDIGNNHNIAQKLIQTNVQKKIKKTENIAQNIINSIPQESSANKPLVHKENVNPLLHDKKITTMNIPVNSGIGKVNQNRAFKPNFSSNSQVKIMIPNKINTGNSTKPQPQNGQKAQNQKKNAPTIVKHNKDDIDSKKPKVKPEFAKGFKFSNGVPQNPNDINQQKPSFRNSQNNNSGLGTSKTSLKFTPKITSTKGKGLTNNNIIRPASKSKANPKKNNKPFEINHFDGDYLPVSKFLTFL